MHTDFQSENLKEQGVKLITHLHLVLRSKNAWSYASTLSVCLHGMMEAQG